MNPVEISAWTVLTTTVLALVGVGGVLVRTTRRARDQIFLGVDPEVLPTGPESAAVGRWRPVQIPTCRPKPPKKARPGELAYLIDPRPRPAALTVTVLDLAVRGWIRISRNEDHEWALERQSGQRALAGFEEQLLADLFGHGGYVTLPQLRQPPYRGLANRLSSALLSRVTIERKWYRLDPELARRAAVGSGGIGLLLSLVAGMLLGQFGWALVGAAGVAVSLAVLFRSRRFAGRTALGSAVLCQAEGFAEYQRQVAADQLGVEDKYDVFAVGLPYAVLFGTAGRWIELFNGLAAQGRHEFVSPWFAGEGDGYPYHFGSAVFADFVAAMNRVAER